MIGSVQRAISQYSLNETSIALQRNAQNREKASLKDAANQVGTQNQTDRTSRIKLTGSTDETLQTRQTSDVDNGFAANVKMSGNPQALQAFYGGSAPEDPRMSDVVSSIHNGTFKPAVTSIATSSPYNLYSNIHSMMNGLQSTGILLNTTA